MGSFFYTSSSLLSSAFLSNPLDVKKKVCGNADSNGRNLQASEAVNRWSKLKPRMISFPFCYLQMASPNRNREDRANKEDINISAQIQGAQAMVSIRVNIQQHVTKQASFPRSHNPDNYNNQVPTGLPTFDKEELLAMQAREGRLQSKNQPQVTWRWPRQKSSPD